jgi:O-antigen/teichoic acid export membrane protein
MSDSLKARTIHALMWSFIESIGLQGVRFVIGIILARILFPEQFGLIAMLTLFIAVAQSFIDSGFGAALIQKRDPSQIDICSIFYFNIVIGFVAAGILCLVAPWIAAFYDQPILIPLTRALSIVIVINSFGLIQNTILTRQITFKILSKVSLTSGILSGMVGVTLAILGYGVWSLVFQQISNSFFSTLFLWLFNSWRPQMVFSFRSLREMFGFGSRLLLSGILNQIFENIYLLVIGRLFSAQDLGFFAKASNFKDLPSRTLAGMVGRVTFPVFSSIQDDPSRLKKGLKKALTTLVLVNFPMMIGLAAIAHPLVVVLLTEKWVESVPYLQLLCFVGLLFPLHLINLNALQALGRSDLFLLLEIIKKVLIVIIILVTWRGGITAMIYGMVATSVLSYYLNSYYTGILIGYSIWEQIRDMYSYLIISVFMGIAVYAVGMLPFPTYWSVLVVQIAIGIVIYISACRLFRLAAFMEIWHSGWSKLELLKTGATG